MSRYVSKVARSMATAQALFAFLSSFEHLSRLAGLEQIEHVEATADQCEISLKGAPMKLSAQIVSREPYKTVKYSDVNGKPMQFTAWIQLKEMTGGGTALRITLDVSIPVVYRVFLTKSKIQDGLDRMVEQLAGVSA